ncbi:hypothetical protein JCM3775_000256 [Rhodotorula graminis]
MPPQPAGRQLLSLSREGSFDWTFVADVRVDLTSPRVVQSHELAGLPFPGRWSVEFSRTAAEEPLSFGVDHNLVAGQLGHGGTVAVRLEWVNGEEVERLAGGLWNEDEFPEGNPETGRAWNGWSADLTAGHIKETSSAFQEQYSKGAVLLFRLRFQISLAKPSPTRAELDLCSRTPYRSFRLPIQPKVRLVFPRGEEPVELWADAELLERSSPYFKTLLTSGFSESVQVGSKRPRRTTSPAEAAAPSS